MVKKEIPFPPVDGATWFGYVVLFWDQYGPCASLGAMDKYEKFTPIRRTSYAPDAKLAQIRNLC